MADNVVYRTQFLWENVKAPDSLGNAIRTYVGRLSQDYAFSYHADTGTAKLSLSAELSKRELDDMLSLLDAQGADRPETVSVDGIVTDVPQQSGFFSFILRLFS